MNGAAGNHSSVEPIVDHSRMVLRWTHSGMVLVEWFYLGSTRTHSGMVPASTILEWYWQSLHPVVARLAYGSRMVDKFGPSKMDLNRKLESFRQWFRMPIPE